MWGTAVSLGGGELLPSPMVTDLPSWLSLGAETAGGSISPKVECGQDKIGSSCTSRECSPLHCSCGSWQEHGCVPVPGQADGKERVYARHLVSTVTRLGVRNPAFTPKAELGRAKGPNLAAEKHGSMEKGDRKGEQQAGPLGPVKGE